MPVADKNWDGDGVPLKDSNVANIGSEEDAAQRKHAAQLEKEWQSAGLEAGVQVWRIENFEVVPWPKEEYGNFYKGDSYIILHTTDNAGVLDYSIFFWLGEDTSTDEMGTAAYKTVELDDYFDGAASQSREVQGRESDQFRALFPKLSYMKGGVASGFHHVLTDAAEAKLYRIRKTKQGVVSQEVTVSKDSLNQGDCFVLDAGRLIYIWVGVSSSPLEKYESNVFAEQLEGQRHGKATATNELDEHFWHHLGAGRIKAAEEATDRIDPPTLGEGILYEVSYQASKLHLEEVGRGDVKKEMLVSSTAMLFDASSEIVVWIGKQAPAAASREAYNVAFTYLRRNDRDVRIPVHVYKEGSNITNPVWTKAFAN